MLTSPSRLWLFVAASSAAHASLGLMGGQRGAAHTVAHVEPRAIDVEITLDEGLEAPSPSPPPAPQVRSEGVRRAGGRAGRAEPVAPAPPSPAPPAEMPAPAPPSVPEPTETPSVVDLSPLAAARSVFDTRAPAPAGPVSKPGSRVVEGVPLDAYLRRAAAARPALSRSDDPTLSATRDGGYGFVGNGFDARIDRDGTVHFDDRYADAEFVLRPQVQADGSVQFVFFRVNFDLTAWAEHMAGNDPYRSERRWFLERTAELRERLAREAFERALSRADRRLRTTLVTLFRDGSVPAEERVRRAFALWNETAPDEVGARARRHIEAVLRELCPDALGCGFTPSLLERLNGSRRVPEPFAPLHAP